MNKLHIKQLNEIVTIIDPEKLDQYFTTDPINASTTELCFKIVNVTVKKEAITEVNYFPMEEVSPPVDAQPRVNIDDLIAKYTETARGMKLWNKANKKIEDELYQDMIAGKLNKVKYYRIINEMDQKTLAKLAGMDQPNISRVEKDDYVADPKTYMKLAKVFGVDYKELMK